MSTDVNRQRSDESAMDAIARIMSGEEWDADTLDSIRDVVLSTGREIKDLDDEDDEDGEKEGE